MRYFIQAYSHTFIGTYLRPDKALVLTDSGRSWSWVTSEELQSPVNERSSLPDFRDLSLRDLAALEDPTQYLEIKQEKIIEALNIIQQMERYQPSRNTDRSRYPGLEPLLVRSRFRVNHKIGVPKGKLP